MSGAQIIAVSIVILIVVSAIVAKFIGFGVGED